MSGEGPLRRLLAFLGPYRAQLAAAVLLGCGAVAANVGLVVVAAYLVAAAALKPALIALSVPMYAVRVLGVGRAMVRYAERLSAHRVTLTLLANLRVWVFERLEPLAPAILVRERSGDLLARLVADVDELQHFYLRVLAPAAVALLMGGLAVAILAAFSPAPALAAAVLLILAAAGLPLLGGRLARAADRRRVECRAERQSLIVDMAQGMPDLLAFGHEGRLMSRLAETDRRARASERRLAWVAGLQASGADLASNLAVWIALVLLVPPVINRHLDGVYLGALVLLIAGSFEVAQPLGQALARMHGVRGAAARVFALADATPEVAEPASAVPAPRSAAMRFEGVSFAYEEGGPAALEQVSFNLEPGRKVALVGPSGAGKSTVINLALRFWDPDGGVVRLGERDVRAYGLDDLRGHFAVVSQDTTLFADTLRNNLLLARPGLTDADLHRAMARARLTGLLGMLPDGLDTWIGEQGLRLSGGERQRVAIARALLKDAHLLLLDEPTANLDGITERAVLESLFELMAGRTVLLISHRLIAMDRMDEILVLDHGRVVQRGTHAGLAACEGPYRRLLAAERAMLATA